MTSATRPGGLTALAVLNFLHGAVGGLQLIGVIVVCVLLLAGQGPREMNEAFEQRLAETGLEREQLAGLLLVSIVGSSAAILCELVAGIGYLGQRRLLGRWAGNTYALVAVAHVVYATTLIPGDIPGGGFTIVTMIEFVYPVYTVILINTVFRRDFVRR